MESVKNRLLLFYNDYFFTQGQNDAVLALHAMETAANSFWFVCVILGSILNDIEKDCCSTLFA